MGRGTRKTRARPLPGQQEFDHVRGAQLSALNRIALPTRLQGLGYPVSRSTVVHVLRVIDDHQRNKTESWPSLETIARCAGLKATKTVSRAIDCLEKLQLIRVTPGTTAEGYPVLILSIDWQVVFGRVPTDEVVRCRRRGGRRRCPEDIGSKPEDIGSKPEDIDANALYKNRPYNRPLETDRSVPRHAQHRHELLDTLSNAEEWEGVRRELQTLGVRAAERAVRLASSRVDPEHVQEICRHFVANCSPRKWKEIDLYNRVCIATGDLAPDTGWPGRPVVRSTTATESADSERRLSEMSDEVLVTFVKQHGNPTMQQHLAMTSAAFVRSEWKRQLVQLLEKS